jgi:hypothetical protein
MRRLFTLLMLTALAFPGCQVEAISASGGASGRDGEPGAVGPVAIEAGRRAKPPGKKEGPRKRPVNLSRCLDSCAAGGQVLVSFCNDIESTVIKASCFSKLRESEQSCIGFCRNYFE